MAVKQNIYRGLNKNFSKVREKMKSSIFLYVKQTNGSWTIGGYDCSIARKIREETANMQGQLQVALKGLDANSKERKKYEKMLKECDVFLEETQ